MNTKKIQIELFKSLYHKDLSINGTVIHGRKIGRKIDFPTANINIQNHDFLPELGVYAVIVWVKQKQYYGMMNVGLKPTFDTSEISFEVHILNFDEDIYHEQIEIIFVKLLRHQLKFNSIDELKIQLEIDKTNVTKLFNI